MGINLPYDKQMDWSEQMRVMCADGSFPQVADWSVPVAITLQDELFVFFATKGQSIAYTVYRKVRGIYCWSTLQSCNQFCLQENTKPALLTKGNKILMAWNGSGKDGLYYAEYERVDSGTDLQPQGKWSSQKRMMATNHQQPIIPGSGTSPALAWAGDKFIISWVGIDDGSIWYGFGTSSDCWNVEKVDIGLGRTGSPALVQVADETVLLAWNGYRDNCIYYSIRKSGGWSGQRRAGTFLVLSDSSPSLTNNDGVITMAWHGIKETDGLFTAHFDPQTRTFGDQTHAACERLGFGSKLSPSINTYKTGVILVWHGYNDKEIYFSFCDYSRHIKGGALVIGSLLWQNDSSDKPGDMVRMKWRQSCLLGNGVRVRVPIRYGRLSKQKFKPYFAKPGCGDGEKGNELHTMVFSMNEKKNPNSGVGYAYQLATATHGEKQLKSAALSLAVAEGISKDGQNITTSWGAIALAINPNSKHKTFLEKIWKNEFIPPDGTKRDDYANKFRIEGEDSVINQDGILRFEFPKAVESDASNGWLEELDFLITSITEPNCKDVFGKKVYPTVEEIARLVKSDLRQYFLNNRRCSIATADDNAIIARLECQDSIIPKQAS